MGETDTVDVATVCPVCSGPLVVDHLQDPARLIAALKKNSDVPAVAMKKADEITEKAAEHGLLYRCPSCGYRMRLHPPAPPAAEGEEDATAAVSGGRTTRGAVGAGGSARRGLPAKGQAAAPSA